MLTSIIIVILVCEKLTFPSKTTAEKWKERTFDRTRSQLDCTMLRTMARRRKSAGSVENLGLSRRRLGQCKVHKPK
jgi:hypothetical protein